MPGSALPAIGLDEPIEVLLGGFREDGAALPPPWDSAIGPWDIPDAGARPYLYVNFIVSRDGRVSFNEPNCYSPIPLALGHRHDSWMMGLLRTRAEAVLVGDGTLRIDPTHVWRPEFIFEPAASYYAALRDQEGLPSTIPLVLLSSDGDMPPSATQFTTPSARTIIATTSRGAQKAAELARIAAGEVDVHVLGDANVDIPRLMELLRSRYGIRRLLAEGGPRVYAALLAAGVVHDEFLTVSPIVLGAEPRSPRPSLVEGTAFRPANAPVSTLLGVARSGDFLFLRSRYATPQAAGSAAQRAV